MKNTVPWSETKKIEIKNKRNKKKEKSSNKKHEFSEKRKVSMQEILDELFKDAEEN